ncbi:DHA2 family efflux MFS transporter permease subunit [Streptomyces sp. NPDC020898]|uniref:DHA2 family efflux MFS transporter permease subunit n=1 Tax=Streptomyces sp. NPDC020898 TaxID=3365101 RepID=UPI003791053D
MPAARTKERLDPALLKMAGILVIGGLAPLLDTTIVNVAIDGLSRQLHSTVTTVQWVSTGYLLAFAMAIPATGWAADRFGAKRVWMWSLALFMLTSAAAGAAWSIGSLIAIRVLQGIAGGFMQPVLQIMLVRSAGPRRLGRILTVVTLAAVVAPVLGPVIGGLIVSNASWRWIFYVNVPLCLIALLLARHHLPTQETRTAKRLDVMGIALLSPGLAAVVYGFTEAGRHGGFDRLQAVVPLVGGMMLLLAFLVHSPRRRDAVLDVRLFRVRSFSMCAVLLFLAGLSLYGAILLLPLYYQQVRGESALTAGLLLAPQGLGALLTRWAGGLTDRIGAKPIVVAGMLLTLVGTLAYTQVGTDTSEWYLGIALVVRGAGLGAATVAIVTGAYVDLAPDDVPNATTVIRIMQQLGGSFGTAALVVILAHETTGTTLADRAAGFGTTFWWVTGFSVLALIPALLLPSRKAPRAAKEAVAGPAGQPADTK